MGLEELKEEILSQANTEAERIRAVARTEAAGITEAARREAAEKRRVSAVESERLLATIRQREESALSLDEKRQLMAARKAVIDETFLKAEQRFASLPVAERKKVIEALLQRARSEIAVARVYCNPKDLSHVVGVSADGADIIGGLIAENDDRSLRVDLSFETLVAEIRERHLEEIARIIFKEK